MIQLDACYFCTTPFQIMTAITMVVSQKEQADLYVVPQFGNADEYAARVEAEHVFHRVRVVEDEDIIQKYVGVRRKGLLNHLSIARSYLHVDTIAKGVLFPDTRYTKMYVSSRSYIGRTVQLHLCKHRADTEIVYIDDGEGSYDNPQLLKPRRGDAIVRTVLFGKESVRTDRKKWLYSPELYFRINGEADRDLIEKIPYRWEEPWMRQMIRRIFGITEEMLIREPVIIMDILADGFYAATEPREELLRIYEKVIKIFGSDRVIIKKHPRDHSPRDSRYHYYDGYGIPFESLCLNMNMSDRVLINVLSTATVIPKLLMDQEPYVVMLYKLLPPDMGVSEKMEKFYRQCKASYRREGRFFIPETPEELAEALEAIRRGMLSDQPDMEKQD